VLSHQSDFLVGLDLQGVVCVGSISGLVEPDAKAILRFDGEVPLPTRGESSFNSVGIKYRQVIARLANVTEDEVQVLWAKERVKDKKFFSEVEGGSETSSLTPTLLGATSSVSLTTSDLTSSFVGFQVETIARKVDETWSKLSEDSINEQLALSSLPPMLVYAAQAPSSRQPIDFTALSRNKLLLAIFAGGLVLACGICSFLSFILFKFQRFPLVQFCPRASIWDRCEWDDLPSEVRSEWMALGYNKTIWDDGYPKSHTHNLFWCELSPGELIAAQTLGYDECEFPFYVHVSILVRSLVPGVSVK